MLPDSATIAPVPEIKAEPGAVPNGSAAKILVSASLVGERYELTLDGKTVGQPLDGNGADLEFTTSALGAPAEFVLRVTRPIEKGILVERRVRISVSIQES
jgi:hypothetical protein